MQALTVIIKILCVWAERKRLDHSRATSVVGDITGFVAAEARTKTAFNLFSELFDR
jgi:hypothetical protein